MICEKIKAVSAVGGKTARACDSCLRKRARWFCAADDAFLCQACDTSVHAANALASSHERVRLLTSSFKGSTSVCGEDSSSPKWLRGLTRKARTPRHNTKAAPAALQLAAKDGGGDVFVDKALNLVDLPFIVPEMSNGEDRSPIGDRLDEEDELLYRVPVLDPFAAGLCMPICDEHELQLGHKSDDDDHELNHQIQGFLQTELELAEFAADVESLLGVAGIEEDQSCIDHDVKGFGLMDDLDQDRREEDGDFDIDVDVDLGGVCANTAAKSEQRVKVEEDESVLGFQVNPNFGSELLSPATTPATEMKKRDILLRLNYEAVIAAWASQGSPWTTGIRPEVQPEHGWPDCMDMCHPDFSQINGDWRGLVGSGRRDGGREARVSRYREKRRTRLFSKKIRVEIISDNYVVAENTTWRLLCGCLFESAIKILARRHANFPSKAKNISKHFVVIDNRCDSGKISQRPQFARRC